MSGCLKKQRRFRGLVGGVFMKKAVRKWLLKAAAKEQNPYMQAEILYSVLKGTES